MPAASEPDAEDGLQDALRLPVGQPEEPSSAWSRLQAFPILVADQSLVDRRVEDADRPLRFHAGSDLFQRADDGESKSLRPLISELARPVPDDPRVVSCRDVAEPVATRPEPCRVVVQRDVQAVIRRDGKTVRACRGDASQPAAHPDGAYCIRFERRGHVPSDPRPEQLALPAHGGNLMAGVAVLEQILDVCHAPEGGHDRGE